MSAATDPPPANSAKPSKWWREAGVYGLLYGIPFLILFPYTRWRPHAELQATVRTQAVDFTVGTYRKAGPFVGGCVDIGFESFGNVKLPGAPRWKLLEGKSGGGNARGLWGGTVRFRHVDFRSLLLPRGTHVRMLWYEPSPLGVEMRVTYAAKPPAAAAEVFVNAKSTVEFHSSSVAEDGAPQNGWIEVPGDGLGMASVYPKEDLYLPVSVTPCAVAAVKAAAGAADPLKGAEKAVALPPAEAIALSPGSRITFLTDDGESAIVGVNNAVQIRNAERKETVLRGQRLEIGGLENRSERDASQIGLQIVKDGIAANILGRAGVLRIDGEDARPSLAEYLRARRVLSTWLTTTILVGSALLTIASRIKLVKLDEKDD